MDGVRIGIELRQITLGASGGVAQYLKGLVETLARTHPQHELTLFCTPFSRGLIDEAAPNIHGVTLPGFNFFQQIDQFAADGRIDVLLRSFPMQAALEMRWSRQIVLLPDLQHERYPEFFTHEVLRLRRLAFNQAMSRAGAIMTLSQYARGTILEHPWNRCADVFVAEPSLQRSHRGSTDATAALSDAERVRIPQGEFFYYPANVWPHKNHRRVLDAFGRMLQATGRKTQFILSGHPEGWTALSEQFAELPVTHLGFVRDSMVRALLERCAALVFMSMHEGFGIPLLEAFDAGAPVICANATSLPEVAGDAAILCDPTDEQAIAQAMARLLESPQLRVPLIEAGHRRLSHFTWERSAAALAEACARLLQPRATPDIRVEDANPLITIVTPSYNQGRFLKATIESVLSQSYPHVQYMVIDGGSSDESVEILKHYGDRFYWVSEKDKGQTDAINKGMRRAQGAIRAYLNSDDVLMPGALATVVEYLRTHPECDLVYGRANYIDERGAITGMYRTDEYSFQRLMQDCCICQPAAFWMARIARQVGDFDESLHLTMDYEYWMRIDRSGGRIEHTHDVLAGSRLYPDTKTLSQRRGIYEEIFDISMKYAGYVDWSYILGLWHHRVMEARSGWPARLRWMPGGMHLLAWGHHKWLHRDHYRPGVMARRTGERLAAGVNRGAGALAARPLLGRVARPAAWALAPVAVPLARVLRRGVGVPDRRVEGIWTDNWMGPQTRILVRPPAPGQPLRCAGIAPVDCACTVECDGEVLGEYQLRGGQQQTICHDLTLDSHRPARLSFKFSGHIIDAANRKLSFLIQETNLFAECDL